MAGSRQTGRKTIVAPDSIRSLRTAQSTCARSRRDGSAFRRQSGWSWGCLKEPEHALALQNASALSLAFPQR